MDKRYLEMKKKEIFNGGTMCRTAPRRIQELFYGVRFNIMRGVKLLAV